MIIQIFRKCLVTIRFVTTKFTRQIFTVRFFIFLLHSLCFCCNYGLSLFSICLSKLLQSLYAWINIFIIGFFPFRKLISQNNFILCRRNIRLIVCRSCIIWIFIKLIRNSIYIFIFIIQKLNHNTRIFCLAKKIQSFLLCSLSQFIFITYF